MEMHVPPRVIRPHVQWRTSADLPTKHGTFRIHVFEEEGASSEQPKEHIALVYGEIAGRKGVPVRVHSECMTSEVFGSMKCDCREQLESAMKYVVDQGAGAVIYLRQEGRGIGLMNKIRAYALQSKGHDTVDANRLLGLPDDAREYHAAADMLDHLGVESIELLTNNPEKVEKLSALGVAIERREPVLIKPNTHSAGYLEAKRLRMAHALPALHSDWFRATGSDAAE
jgi:GTP cyclohydrolase II